MSGPSSPSDILPHAFPFVLLDSVRIESPGVRGTGIKRITSGEFFVRGGSYPQVLLIEAAAQLSGIVLGDVRTGILAGIRDVMFRPRAVIEGEIQLEAQLAGARGNVYAFSVRAFSGDGLLLEGVIYLAMA